ncbi:VOC family protein [Micromonospora sp. NPDC048947]|uniref:VOC family protein n=1 Tax=Micromonospora sp. NPDC048947 TaxID=3154826 RepID=UPI003401785D
MTSHLFAITFDASEPLRLAQFWSGLLGREIVDDPHDGVLLLPNDDNEYHLRFVPNQQPKVVQNRMHFDLTSSSLADQRQTVARALELGARHADIGQGPEIDHVVLADPEGNEFDVIAPGNNFLAGCGFVGALACDGSQAVGYFWSQALGWPLVWDQDEETAIQSPNGGTKISWGGPPYMPNGGRDRVRFDLTPPVDVDPQAEADRLLSLGATRIDTHQDRAGRLALADPDGQEFSLLTSR